MESSKRPWGQYDVLLDKPYTKVKELTILPGGKLSLQYHNKRAEYHVIVQGDPTVQIGDETVQCVQGMSYFIPIGKQHRVFNGTETTVKILEIQIGESFEEDDIVRLDDDYGRAGIGKINLN